MAKYRINLNFFFLPLLFMTTDYWGQKTKEFRISEVKFFCILNFILSYIFFRLVLIYYSTFVKRLFHFH